LQQSAWLGTGAFPFPYLPAALAGRQIRGSGVRVKMTEADFTEYLAAGPNLKGIRRAKAILTASLR